MGAVHLGTMVSPAGERRVAIKRLLGKDEVDHDAAERFVAEARLVFQLTHANICQVIDLGENDDGTFIVMEHVQGLDLRTLLQRMMRASRPLDVGCAVYVAREMARALDYAHRRVSDTGQPLHLVHGDVTPQNILLSIEGEVKLADFGIARALGAAAPGNRLRGGTPGYMAPEALTGSMDHRADIYSLGTTLAAVLTGRPPSADGPDLAALHARSDVPKDVLQIIERAVSRSPSARFLSAGDLERALSGQLARRFPDFTPSQLADLVRAHATSQPTIAPREVKSTLVSIAATEATLATVIQHSTEPRASGTQSFVVAAPWMSRRKLAIGACITAVVGVVLGVAMLKSAPTATANTAPTAAVNVAAPPPENKIANNNAANSTAPIKEGPRRVTATPKRANAAAPKNFVPAPPPRVNAEPGFLTVNSTPWGQVYVDGRRASDETPLYRMPLAAGAHQVSVFYPDLGSRSKPKKVVITSTRTETLGFTR